MTQPVNASTARLIRQANAEAASGSVSAAQATAREAVNKAKSTMHKASQAAAHYTLATMLWADEDASTEEARDHAARAVELALVSTDEYFMAVTLLARIEAGIGNFNQARVLNQNLLATYRRKGRLLGVADVLRSFGDIALKEGNLDEARLHFDEALSLYDGGIDDPLNMAGLLLSFGSLEFALGDSAAAEELWSRALELGKVHGYHQVIVLAERSLEILSESQLHD